MFQVALINNPLDIYAEGSMERYRFHCHEGLTIRGWLKSHYGEDFEDFQVATLCQLNGESMMRATWDETELKHGDILTFTILPGDPVSIIIAIVAVVVAVAAVLMMPDPQIPGDQTEAGDPAYTLRGQTNRVRLGEPIECHYGRVRSYPSYAASPYNRYVDNDSYQYSLFCLGQGEYLIDEDEIFLEDTPITSFDDIEIEIIPPGGEITLLNSRAYTSAEVSSIELFGTNEDDYDGPVGGFIVNPAGTTVSRLEVDLVLPQGLYVLYESYRINEVTAYEFEYREVDDDGVAVGLWETLAADSISAKTADPLRYTFGVDVTAGRYEIRGRRSNEKKDSSSRISTTIWESARGLTALTNNYGDVTMIALKALAQNQLNSSTRSRFNLFAERKVPIWNVGEQDWDEPTATRNPIWAMCDCFRAAYGAELETEFFNLEDLVALATVADDNEFYFDWTFDTSTGLWQAAKMIVRVMRTLPVPQGTIISAVRDIPRTLPSAVFNMTNIEPGSLKAKYKMFQHLEADSLEIEYMDPITWKPEYVLCQYPGQTGDRPDRLKLAGCSDRDRAYREGMHIEAGRKLRRKTVSFVTGTEGNIPSYMDLVAVSENRLLPGKGGFVVDYDDVTNVMTLSEKVIFTDGYDHVICLRGEDGAAMGTPITVTEGAQANQVILAVDPDETIVFDELNQVPPLFLFGVEDLWGFLGNVTSIRPLGGSQRVEISLLEYQADVYLFDEELAPAVPEGGLVQDPDPTVDTVRITTLPDTPDFIKVSWSVVWGALSYEVQTSVDGGPWTTVGTTAWNQTSLDVPVVPGELTVRIVTQGRRRRGGFSPSVTKVVGVYGNPPADVSEKAGQPVLTDEDTSFTWNVAAAAAGYSVEVYKTDGLELLRQEDVFTAQEYTYTVDDMLEDVDTDPPVRDLTFYIKAYNSGGSSDPAILNTVNAKPAAITGAGAVVDTGNVFDFSWTGLTLPDDFLEYRVYGSTTMGFTPGPGNLLGTSATAALNADIGTATRPFYWRVAAFDKYAVDDEDANFSSEQTIA